MPCDSSIIFNLLNLFLYLYYQQHIGKLEPSACGPTKEESVAIVGQAELHNPHLIQPGRIE